MKKNIGKTIVGVAIIFLLTVSCGNTIYNPGGTETVNIEVQLFTQQEDGSYLFSANDPKYIGMNGTTIWKIGSVSTDWENQVYAVTIQKTSGNNSGAAGIVFSSKDAENFLTLLINNSTRKYKIGKKVKGSDFEVIIDWTYSDNLNGSYAANTVLISYESDTNTYTISFNGEKSAIFSDNDEDPFKSGYMGYLAEIHSDDQFPEVPVTVRYHQIIPAAIGIITPD